MICAMTLLYLNLKKKKNGNLPAPEFQNFIYRKTLCLPSNLFIFVSDKIQPKQIT